MRYIILSVLFLSFVGCKKDADRDIPSPGISFLYGGPAGDTVNLRPSASPQRLSSQLVVYLRGANPAASDIDVSLAENSTAIVNAYNTANGAALEVLPPSLWNMPAKLTIKRGAFYALGEITVANTSTLDYSREYAIGLTITNVSAGTIAADGFGNMLLIFKLRHEMDGIYNVRGRFYDPVANTSFSAHSLQVQLQTTGTNRVRVLWPVTSYAVPIFQQPLNTQTALPGAYELTLENSPAITPVQCLNTATGATAPWQQLTAYNSTTYTNRWDTAAKAFYLGWGLNLSPTGTFVSGTSTAWIDTLTYVGPR